MLDRLIALLSASETPPEDRIDAARIAVAAILVEAAMADGVYLAAEKTMIDRVLAGRFGLTVWDAASLRVKGEAAQAEATDLVRFTRVIKDAVPHAERVDLIEAVWRVVYADDTRVAEEGNLVRRLAGLLYVPDCDAGPARQRVVAARSAGYAGLLPSLRRRRSRP